MTLALLITAVSGAWAQTASYDIKEFVAPAAWETDEAVFTDADLPEDGCTQNRHNCFSPWIQQRPKYSSMHVLQ